MSSPTAIRSGLLLYLVFVVYGSLVPFEYRAYSLDEAFTRFSQIPWLNLDAGSRADWVANLVLYVPLALLCSAWLTPNGRHLSRVLVAAVLCFSVAVGVEFTQIFFAPRTVSLNDLLAEGLGTAIGCAVWLLGHRRLSGLWRGILEGGRASLAAATVGYALLYLLLSLFPYDFVVSFAELSEKSQAHTYGWLLAGESTSLLRRLAGLGSEFFAILSLGVLMGFLVQRLSLWRTFVLGLLVGLILEAAQFLLISGVSQGASILIRGLGLASGALLGSTIRETGLLPLARGIQQVRLILWPLYGLGLIIAAGWLSQRTHGFAGALAQWQEVRLMPFYYHYYTTEPIALSSLLANVGLYAPLGLLAWARHACLPRFRRRGAWEPAIWALACALLIEFSKLWLARTHPDFTNLLIGATSAASTYLLLGWLSQVIGQTSNPENATATAGTPVSKPPVSRIAWTLSRPTTPWLLLSLMCLVLIFAGLWHYPVATPILAAALMGYGAILWRSQLAWLFALPAFLPILDLAPYTGQRLLNEFDLLVLTTLGVACWRSLPRQAVPWPSRGYAIAFALLVLSSVSAMLVGLLPLLYGDEPTLASSHSPLQAFVVGKGLIWALLLVSLLRRILSTDHARAQTWLISGLITGLALLSAVVLWERHVYVGITDFADVFRVTGNFSATRTGGAYLEGYIALVFPALAVWTLQQQRPLHWLIGLLIAALASYAMLVTFSRGGYAGLIIGMLMVAGMTWRAKHHTGSRPLLRGLILLFVISAATIPVFLGSFAQERLARAQQDLQTRLGHWQQAINLMDAGPLTAFFGMGFGQYPSAYLWGAPVEKPPGSFAIQQTPDHPYLRLGGGDAYYLDQVVGVRPGGAYQLQMRTRFVGDINQLKIALCEKALLYSFQCQWHVFPRDPSLADGNWQTISMSLNSRALGETGRWPKPTLKLSIAGPDGRGAVDIARLRLTDGTGRELIANGDFSEGLSRWLASTDRDLAWHIHQTPLEVYFAQGLLGLLALFGVLVACIRTLRQQAVRHTSFSITILAGLTGCFTVGLLGSTLDAPRLSFLFYLFAFTGLIGHTSPSPDKQTSE